MKINYKCLTLVMFVMLICCVSAASATDVDNITVPDDTDVIEIDDAVDSVEEVEIDEVDDASDAADNSVDSKVKEVTVTDSDYNKYFDENGYLNDTTITGVTFNGNFNAKSFGNFKINRTISLNVAGATFNGVNFDLLSDGLVLDGATFINNARSPSDTYTYVTANNAVVQNLNVILTAGANVDFYGISVENAENVTVLNNTITYTCNQNNSDNYNYVIRAMNCKNLKIAENNIIATLPLKTVKWAYGIGADYVLGVGIQDCEKLNFTKNNITITANRRVGLYPTLDAVMIVGSNNAYVGDNKIIMNDIVTKVNEYAYMYGIDVYSCNNITINNNTIDMNGNNYGGTYSGNGTGAAYCIQLTGPHTGVVISNNTLTTKNNGPNLGIYSQNYYGETNLTIYGNHINVTGKAGSDPWSLVSGMELQDTYATVYNNTIVVNNTANFATDDCVYGISYCQETDGLHHYYIYQNNVTVYNGEYTIYIVSADGGSIGNNVSLIAYEGSNPQTGNSTIYAPDLGF